MNVAAAPGCAICSNVTTLGCAASRACSVRNRFSWSRTSPNTRLRSANTFRLKPPSSVVSSGSVVKSCIGLNLHIGHSAAPDNVHAHSDQYQTQQDPEACHSHILVTPRACLLFVHCGPSLLELRVIRDETGIKQLTGSALDNQQPCPLGQYSFESNQGI